MKTVPFLFVASSSLLLLLIRCCNGSTSSRSRISRYVDEGQMFFIRDNGVALGRNLSNTKFPSNEIEIGNVEWFCAPTFGPDNDEDGNYDNVVSVFITYTNDLNKFADIGGYTAAWTGGSYDEVGTDFAIRTNRYNVIDDRRSSVIQWTLDGGNSTQGMITSQEGRWTFDTTESIFDGFKGALGDRELTGETCKSIYNEIYVENAAALPDPPTPAPTSDPCVVCVAPTPAPTAKKSSKKKGRRALQQTLSNNDSDNVDDIVFINKREYLSLIERTNKLEKTVDLLMKLSEESK